MANQMPVPQEVFLQYIQVRVVHKCYETYSDHYIIVCEITV
jgi:hypothetical protein